MKAYWGVFSYFNDDLGNIRNKVEYGGGALMDIGCYLVNTARMVFGREPRRVSGSLDRDPRSGTDIVTSVAFDFAPGQAVGLCSTQMVPAQRVIIYGSKGRIDVEIPFNAPPDKPCRVFVDDGSTLSGPWKDTIELTDDQSVHGAGRSFLSRGPGSRATALPARRCHREHARDRRGVSRRGCRNLGNSRLSHRR